MGIGSIASSALFQMEQNMTTSVSGIETPSDIGVAMLSKQLDASESNGEALIRAMELSVNPSVGSNIDVYA